MKRARILSPWVGDGSRESPNRPAIADAFPLRSWSDVTGTPAEQLHPTPNLLVVEVTCEDAVLTQIRAHPEYGPGVLRVEGEADTPLTAREHTDLGGRLLVSGAKTAEVTEAIGNRGAVTRTQLAERLARWLEARPKAENREVLRGE